MKTVVLAALLTFAVNFPAPVAALKDINEIALPTRQGWCTAQVTTCPSLCSAQKSPGKPRTNQCVADNLFYQCICADGTSPDLTQVSETIPYYLCVLDSEDCVAKCDRADNACSAQCRKDYVCGATNPKAPNGTVASTSASQTASKNSAATSINPTKLDSNGFPIVGNDAASTDNTSAKSASSAVGLPYIMGLTAAGLALGAALMGL